MTRTTNSRVAGFTFLLYIAVAMTGTVLSNRAITGEGTAAKLASIAQHASEMRVAIVLDLISCFCALVLAGTLWAITRDQDPDLAMLGLTCRVAEGVIGAVSIPRGLGQLWLATATGANAPDPAAANALGASLLKLPSWSFHMAGISFAVGSTIFASLFLRGRMVPATLAWLGVIASSVTVVGLLLQLVGVLHSPITDIMWIPVAAFEVWLAFWLMIKGAAMPPRRQTA